MSKQNLIKMIGQIQMAVTDGTGSSVILSYSREKWKEMEIYPGDWVKYKETEDGGCTIEKITPCDYCKNGKIIRELQE